MARMGYPNIKILVYPDYDHYLNDQYYDVSLSYLKLNIRENIRGLQSGTLIILDGKNLIQDTTELIFKITFENNVVVDKREFIMGTTHNDLTILANGEPARTYNLVPYHNRKPRRFSKKLTNSAVDSLNELLDILYLDHDVIRPELDYIDMDNTNETTVSIEEEGGAYNPNTKNIDAYVPSAVWVQPFDNYMSFVTDKGLSLENDEFVFCWYDADKIRILDFNSILESTPLEGIVAEEDLVGTMGILYEDKIPVFKYEFLTEANPFNRDFNLNTFYIATSTEKNGSYAQVVGTGENVVHIDRSCIYREMTYSNGYEEINRDMTLNQFDVYAKFRAFGDTRLKPANTIRIDDEQKLINNINIIDEVLHEASQEYWYSHVYTISHTKDLIEYELDMELNQPNVNYPQREYETGSYDNGEVTSRANNPNDVQRKVGLFGDEYNFEPDDSEWTMDEDGNKVEVK